MSYAPFGQAQTADTADKGGIKIAARMTECMSQGGSWSYVDGWYQCTFDDTPPPPPPSEERPPAPPPPLTQALPQQTAPPPPLPTPKRAAFDLGGTIRRHPVAAAFIVGGLVLVAASAVPTRRR